MATAPAVASNRARSDCRALSSTNTAPGVSASSARVPSKSKKKPYARASRRTGRDSSRTVQGKWEVVRGSQDLGYASIGPAGRKWILGSDQSGEPASKNCLAPERLVWPNRLGPGSLTSPSPAIHLRRFFRAATRISLALSGTINLVTWCLCPNEKTAIVRKRCRASSPQSGG